MRERIKSGFIGVVVIMLLCAYTVPYAIAAISQIVTIALDRGSYIYSTVKDASLSTNSQLSSGVVPTSQYVYNGTDMDRATVGSAFYAIKNTGIGASSVNFAFGFPSKKISIETPSANTDEVCIDWGGGTAVCPAAQTAGDDRVAAGRITILDDFIGTSVSVIAASGTQTIYIRAWR